MAVKDSSGDIAGLSERLRADANELTGWGAGNEATRVKQAATQLDTLLKEREALEARVKELEDKLPRALTAQRRVLCADHDKDIAELHRVRQISKEILEAAESRARRAEQERVSEWNLRRETESQRDAAKAVAGTLRQERDEAVILLRPLVILAEDSAALLRKHNSDLSPYIASLALRARAFGRRLAGRTEKEKK